MPASTQNRSMRACSPAFRALLGKAAIVDHRGFRAALGGGFERGEDALVAEAEDRDIRRFRKLGGACVAGAVEDARVIRVDRKDPAGKPDTRSEFAAQHEPEHVEEFGDDPSPHRHTSLGSEQIGVKRQHRLVLGWCFDPDQLTRPSEPPVDPR